MPFSEDQVAKLDEKINQKLVKTRDKAGIKLSYLDHPVYIRNANRIFGHGMWSSTLDFHEVISERVVSNKGREGWEAWYKAIVSVHIRGGGKDDFVSAAHSEVGFGSGTSYISPGDAHELAGKEAATDALKRALHFFGDQFGLSLYEKGVTVPDLYNSEGAPTPIRRSSPKKGPSPYRGKVRAELNNVFGSDTEGMGEYARWKTGKLSVEGMSDEECIEFLAVLDQGREIVLEEYKNYKDTLKEDK
jgi:hypothetical protein|tara:strand:+ start:279 stop:1016 length:738 start_codon:yes stop_codon:yes gene_type:complete